MNGSRISLLLLLPFFQVLTLSAQEVMPFKAPSDVAVPLLAPFQERLMEREAAKLEAMAFVDSMIDYANGYLGCKYRSGGKGPKVFDCSGFMGYVFKHFGMDLAASSREQYLQGEKVDDDKIQPGDLVFFSGRAKSKTVGHVGMVVDVDSSTGVIRFVHASVAKGVTYDVYPDGGYYSKRYIGAKRMIDNL